MSRDKIKSMVTEEADAWANQTLAFTGTGHLKSMGLSDSQIESVVEALKYYCRSGASVAADAMVKSKLLK